MRRETLEALLFDAEVLAALSEQIDYDVIDGEIWVDEGD